MQITFRQREKKSIQILFAIILWSLSNSTSAEGSTNDFLERFKLAKSEKERLSLSIDAVSNGTIYRGIPVNEIDKMFGSHYGKKIPSKGEPLNSGVIDFAPTLNSPADSIAAAREGWYFAFQFDSNGSVQNYYFTNLHK